MRPMQSLVIGCVLVTTGCVVDEDVVDENVETGTATSALHSAGGECPPYTITRSRNGRMSAEATCPFYLEAGETLIAHTCEQWMIDSYLRLRFDGSGAVVYQAEAGCQRPFVPGTDNAAKIVYTAQAAGSFTLFEGCNNACENVVVEWKICDPLVPCKTGLFNDGEHPIDP